MQRVPEPELMDDPAQVRAYAEADFSEPHDHFVSLFQARFGEQLKDTVLDLGCGPGDICHRFVRAYPDCRIHAVDAAQHMLTLGRELDRQAGLEDRIDYTQCLLPAGTLPQTGYHTIISNSLLHHLPKAETLWQSIRQFGNPGCRIFVMDLLRPASQQAAQQLVDQYAAGEAEILQQDFYNSLLAAYRADEIHAQLTQQGLEQLRLETISDRHMIVHGTLPGQLSGSGSA